MSESETREAICCGIARILREERERQGLSMTRLAEKAGLSKGMISLVEHDLRNPTIDTLLRISRVLKVDLGHVIQDATVKATRHRK